MKLYKKMRSGVNQDSFLRGENKGKIKEPHLFGARLVERIMNVAWLALACLTFQSCALLYNEVGLDRSTSECANPQTATIQPLYSGFENWNDYVRAASTTTACDGSEVGDGYYWACLHAGERKKVELSGLTSCDGVSAEDDLGAFDWYCDDSGSTAYVYSLKLNEGKGLANLIDPASGTAFLENFVSVMKDGCVIFETEASSSWWGNTLTPLPNVGTANAFQTLSSGGTIYTLTTSGGTNGFELDADRIAVVTLGSAVLNFYGTNADSFLSSNTIIGAQGNKFLWVEGKFLGDPDTAQRADHGVHFSDVDFSRIHLLSATSTEEAAIYFTEDSENNLISEVTVSTASRDGAGFPTGGITIYNGAFDSDYNTIMNTRVDNTINGGALDLVSEFRLYRVTMSNNSAGNTATLSNNSVIVGLTSINSGVGFSGNAMVVGEQNTTAFYTALGSWVGYGNLNKNDNTLSNALFMGSDNGIDMRDVGGGSARNQFVRVALSNGENGISFNGAFASNDDNRVLGELWVGNNGTADCFENGTGPTGNWLDNACNYGSATPVTPADSTSLDMNGAVIAQATSDSTNPQGGTATAAFASVTDWNSFDSFYRGWGRRNTGQATEIHQDHQQQCTTGETCHIWDVRFSSSGSLLKNIAGTFDANNCPLSVDASDVNNVVTDRSATPRTFLVSAMEIVGDFIGNENGLCESNESCVFAPHVGSYLGEGDYKNNGSCVYSGGNGVNNYTIYGFPTTEGAEN